MHGFGGLKKEKGENLTVNSLTIENGSKTSMYVHLYIELKQ